MVKGGFGVLLLFFLAVPLHGGAMAPASAQEAEVQLLQSRILQLEQRVEELEALLAETQGVKKGPEGEQTGWQNKKNWRKLSHGMRDEEVRGILGNPSKVIRGVRTLWYYPNIYCGHLTFDERGQLIGWNEP
jgi:hypothetical protein